MLNRSVTIKQKVRHALVISRVSLRVNKHQFVIRTRKKAQVRELQRKMTSLSLMVAEYTGGGGTDAGAQIICNG